MKLTPRAVGHYRHHRNGRGVGAVVNLLPLNLLPVNTISMRSAFAPLNAAVSGSLTMGQRVAYLQQARATMVLASRNSTVRNWQSVGGALVAAVNGAPQSATWNQANYFARVLLSAQIHPQVNTQMWAKIATAGINAAQNVINGMAAAGMRGLPRYVGMGDVNFNDTTLGTAAQALLTQLSAAGCQAQAVSQVSDFQTAYNNAGATTPLTVDGLYGGDTQTALQAVINGAPTPLGITGQTAPAGCVGASTGAYQAPTVTVPGTPAANNASAPSQTVSVGGTDLLPIALAGVAGAGLIGWAIYAKKHPGHGRLRHAHR